jgi:hypothetical protein
MLCPVNIRRFGHIQTYASPGAERVTAGFTPTLGVG